MKKKLLALMLVCCMVLAMAGCGKKEEPASVRIGSLKGPTSMGIMRLMEQAENGKAQNDYRFTMETAADTLLTMMLKDELDIALLPANVASILYQKSEGKIAVIDINTLGVLYMVSGDDTIRSFEDLKGKTLYLTGKGTTPDYVLQYLMKENGITEDEVTIEYKSEATEVAALLAENPANVGLLPQPFVTAALAKNQELAIIMDMNEEWEKVAGESRLVTGVTVVRKAFLEENKDAVAAFLEEHKASAEYANTNVEATAELVANAGIIEKAAVAAKALPYCNITYIDGEEMKSALSGYLEVLFELDPSAVGGALPDEDFYETEE